MLLLLVPVAGVQMTGVIACSLPPFAHMSMQASFHYFLTGMTSGRPECSSPSGIWLVPESLAPTLCRKPEPCNLQGTCQKLKV